MALNAKAKARQSTTISRETEGSDVFVRALRDGSLITADWKQAAILAGYGYTVNVGALSTGIVGGGNGTVIDQDEPECVLTIPNGYCVLPLRIAVQVQSGAVGDAEEVEILIAVDQDKALDATSIAGSTYTTEVIYNLNTLCGSTSSCACYSAFTDTITDPVLDLELARKVIEYEWSATSGSQNLEVDLLYEPKNPPVINGPAQIVIYWGGDTATIGGFAEIQFLEFPESAFTL